VFGNRGPKRRGPKRRATPSQFDPSPSPGIFETVIGLAAPRRQPPGGASAKTDRRPRLVDLAIDLLALIHAVFGPEAQIDIVRVRAQWIALRATFEAAAKDCGHRESDIKAAVYALAVTLDEAVMRHPDKIGAWLQAGALQLEFHEQRDLVGGRRFFEMLDELRNQRESAIEAIEVFDACLALGYRGRFVTDAAGREAMRTSLLTDITAVRGEPSRTLAPNVARTDEQTGETLKQLPAWVPPAVLAGAILLSWLTVVLITFLHARAVSGALSRM
jgi:type VI secretion system protein ImpK